MKWANNNHWFIWTKLLRVSRLFALSSLIVACALSNFALAESDKAQRLDDVNAEIRSLSETIAANQKERDALYQQLKQQSNAVSALNRRLRTLNQTLAEKNKQLAELEKQQQQFEQSHAQQLADLHQQIRTAYLQAQPHFLKVLLNQQDPAKLSRANTYFTYFHQARQDQLTQIDVALSQLDSQKLAVLTAREEQQALIAQQETQQQALKKQSAQRLATAKQLDQKLRSDQARVSALKEEAAALQNLLDSLAQTKTVTSLTIPFPQLKGKLIWPHNGKIDSRFGSPRQIGQLKWQGIMIKTPNGDEIVSAAAGRVIFSDWLRGFGLLLIIDHGDKYMTLYGNNQSLLKSEGDTVSAGEVIALSGSQGIKPYPGLYFELRHQGAPINPTRWLGKRS